jgi:hypothetical protein
MTRQIARFILFAGLLALASGTDRPAPPSNTAPADSHVSFVPVDVFIDPHGKPLACYQVKILATAGDVKLVGIEGGDSAAFRKAPYYDPRALQGNQIILGAYSLDPALPDRNTRAATLMFRVAGTATPNYDAKLEVAGAADGTEIAATVSLVPVPPADRIKATIPNSHGDAQ